MSKIVLITNIAKDDITQIAEYIATNNKLASVKIVDGFYKSFELLANFPETGSLKNGIKNKTIRVYIMKKKFAIVYRVCNGKIEILRILTRYQNIFAIMN